MQYLGIGLISSGIFLQWYRTDVSFMEMIPIFLILAGFIVVVVWGFRE